VAAGELEAGFTAVGAPVRNFAGEVVAAISVGGPSLRLPAERLPEVAHLVMASAERISQQLGY
jgi:DNA-binding IclR family transcriptional regulator